ncbi:hypothetical protein B0H14DRAFT_3470262 [Mycena olivaceomarginata]|nr:hypothetical protein B0H14DRAFT_3470262 [Mycena olivaceomarginata]
MYPAHVFPSRSLRPPRSPPALFHGHEDCDGDVYRPFVSGFDNNPVVSRAAFLSARSPSHSPSSCTPVPTLYPVHRSRWSSSSLSSPVPPPSAYPHFIEPDPPSGSSRPRRTGSSSALQRSCPTTATATSGGGPSWSTSPPFAATPLPACNGYAGLIRVLLIISCALSLCMRGRAAFVLPSFTEPRLIAFLSIIYQLTLNLKGFRHRGTMQHGEGYSHSGKLGQINFLDGVMGYTKGRCMLDYIRRFVEAISLHQYKDLIPMFGIVNEAYLHGIGRDVLTSLYLQAHNMIRGIMGYGAGNGPFIHDGFQGTAWWTGFLPARTASESTRTRTLRLTARRAERLADRDENGPLGSGRDMAEAGVQLAGAVVEYESAFRVTLASAFSNRYNDSELYLTGVNGTQHCETARCSRARAHGTTSPRPACARVDGRDARLVPLDVKIGPALDGVVCSPLWPYHFGLQTGFMPIDPRDSRAADGRRGCGDDRLRGRPVGQWPPATLSNVDVSATPLPTHIASLTLVMPVADCT